MVTQLEREKRKDYRNATIVQVLIVIACLTLEDLVPGVAWPFFLVATAIYMYLLWDMLRNFTDNRWVLRGTLALLVALYLVGLLVNQFLFGSGLDRTPVNVFLFASVLVVQLVVIVYAIADLFRSPRNTTDKLWGTACIYFMSGFAFAVLFHVIHLLHPAAFGGHVSTGYVGFFEALYLSFNSLVGLDSAYPDVIHLVRNLCVLEGMWGQLYLVLLIGRVLMPPEGEQAPAGR